jgi:hypothetical protein
MNQVVVAIISNSDSWKILIGDRNINPFFVGAVKDELYANIFIIDRIDIN